MRMRIIVLVIFSWFLVLPSFSDEGMWLPWQLSDEQIEKMQEAGLQLSPEELFNTEGESLKDAIVSL
ncbi:MAG: S46 family peptidase, partial [Marinilabilia sp.]